MSTAIFVLLCDFDFFGFSCSNELGSGYNEAAPWGRPRKGLLSLSGMFVAHLTIFVAGLSAEIVSLTPLGLLRTTALVSILQCRSTSAVFREDRPSKESSSSGRRPMMCPSS